MAGSLSPNVVPGRYAAGSKARRVDWNAAANALFAAILLFSELAALGLGMAWGLVGLLGLSDTMIGALAAPIVAGALAAAIWMYRAAYAADRENRAETAGSRSPAAGGAAGGGP